MIRLFAAVLLAGALALVAGCGDDEESTTPTVEEAVQTEAGGASTKGESDEKQPNEGGPDDSDLVAPQPEMQITEAAVAFLVSPDSEAVCKDLVTTNLIEASYGSVSGCLDGRPKPTLADSVKAAEPKVDGSEATVVATPDGGLYDGVEVEFTLVLEGETWLIDSVSADIPVGP